ncbi:MAG: hypothetical protein ACI910_000409 [Oleispira sp.]|jgi:hypothetical protein
MKRTLLASAILMAISSHVFAGNIAESLETKGAVSYDIISAALEKCTDTACESDIIIEAIEVGIDATSVMSVALAADIDVNTIASALRSANVSESDIFTAAIANNQNPEDFIDATATGIKIIGSSTRVTLPTAAVPKGISPAGKEFSGPDNFDVPGFSVTTNNGIEFD